MKRTIFMLCLAAVITACTAKTQQQEWVKVIG